jgi:hypothetical protein
MSNPATVFGRLRSLQLAVFLVYLALVFRSFFPPVSLLPADLAKTLDLTLDYLVRYLSIFLINAVMLVTNAQMEVVDAFIALGVVLIGYGLGRVCLRLFVFGLGSLGEEFVFGAGLGLVLLAGPE